MAIRSLSRNFVPIRFLSPSSFSTLSAFSEKPELPLSQTRLNLDDYAQRPLASVPASKLLQSYLNLHLVSREKLVEIGSSVLTSILARGGLPQRLLVNLLKPTVYSHFCGGENLEEATRTVASLWNDSLSAILVYGLEEVEDNSACDRNVETLLRMFNMASDLPPHSASFICMKITAICSFPLLEKVSNLLRWQQRIPSFDLPWQGETLPVLSASSPLYHTQTEPDHLSPDEVAELEQALCRLSLVCQKCVDKELPLLVDAEHTVIQPAIDFFTNWAAMHFNNNTYPIVYGTIQTYLKDAKERLIQVTEAAQNKGISIGFKLVRGAYLTREAQLASSLGAASPIHSSIEKTHACFNECACLLLEKVADSHGSVVFGTHNYESGKLLAGKVEELGIARGCKHVHFAQLHGMADGLSYALRDAGFNVSKYLPIGPVADIVPYLLRRAEENQGALSSSSTDRKLIRMEIKRRLSGHFGLDVSY